MAQQSKLRRRRRTKIIATLGPASSTAEVLLRLLYAGADVFRLNFSHGTHDDHAKLFAIIRDLERQVGHPIGILADVQGPKLRVGRFGGGRVQLQTGHPFRLDLNPTPGDVRRVNLPHPEIIAAASIGTSLLLDDGKLRLRVTHVREDHLETEVAVGGALSDRKGVNVPDMVLPLPTGRNGIGSADTPTDTVNATYTLPTNTVRAYLDLITESQGNDEFWYLGVPDALKDKLKAGGGTAFREAEVTVDGRPAGIAPIFPWIYTGGIDPGLWRPIPGIQTLSFAPYRVNLTPFVGVLNDGKPHTLGVRIVNNQNHFQVAGVLLLFRDPKLKAVHGALTADTLTADPVVQSRITDAHGAVSGPVSVISNRQFIIAGYALTSAGKISTRISQFAAFSSVQQFEKSAAKDDQNLTLETGLASETKTQTPASQFIRRDNFRYPLRIRFSRTTRPDGTASQTTVIAQMNFTFHSLTRQGVSIFSKESNTSVSPSDTREFDAAGKLVRRSSFSSQVFEASDTPGTSYTHILVAINGTLTSNKATGKSR